MDCFKGDNCNFVFNSEPMQCVKNRCDMAMPRCKGLVCGCFATSIIPLTLVGYELRAWFAI